MDPDKETEEKKSVSYFEFKCNERLGSAVNYFLTNVESQQN